MQCSARRCEAWFPATGCLHLHPSSLIAVEQKQRNAGCQIQSAVFYIIWMFLQDQFILGRMHTHEERHLSLWNNATIHK